MYGYYEEFQPIGISPEGDLETAVSIPYLRKNTESNTSISQFEDAMTMMPIFYIAYVDEVGERSDLKESIGIIIDIALTVTVIGNVAKLRYIRYSSVLWRSLGFGAQVQAYEIAAFWKFLTGIVATGQILLDAFGIAYNLYTDRCNNYLVNGQVPPEGTDDYVNFKNCEAINAWIFALTIVSLAPEEYTKRQVKRQSRILRSRVDSIDNLIPADKTKLLNALESLSDIVEDIEAFQGFLTSKNATNFLSHFNGVLLQNEDKAYAMILAFSGRSKSVNKINLNLHWLDDLVEHTDFSFLSQRIEYISPRLEKRLKQEIRTWNYSKKEWESLDYSSTYDERNRPRWSKQDFILNSQNKWEFNGVERISADELNDLMKYGQDAGFSNNDVEAIVAQQYRTQKELRTYNDIIDIFDGHITRVNRVGDAKGLPYIFEDDMIRYQEYLAIREDIKNQLELTELLEPKSQGIMGSTLFRNSSNKADDLDGFHEMTEIQIKTFLERQKNMVNSKSDEILYRFNSDGEHVKIDAEGRRKLRGKFEKDNATKFFKKFGYIKGDQLLVKVEINQKPTIIRLNEYIANNYAGFLGGLDVAANNNKFSITIINSDSKKLELGPFLYD